MDGPTAPAIPSRAAIAGHPLHPMLVAFPVAFLSLAFACDVAWLFRRDHYLAWSSAWLLGLGLATGVAAAAAGLADFVARPAIRGHRAAWIHLAGNCAVLLLAAFNLLWRAGAAGGAVAPVGVALSGATFALLCATGWYGGELIYRHGAAVAGPGGTGRHGNV